MARKSKAYIPPSKSNDWETPADFFAKVAARHTFSIDLAADKHNAKCPRYYTEKDDALSKDWSGETAWCNPPYGRVIAQWIEKAAKTVAKDAATTIVVLVPARTDTKWFHSFCLENDDCTVEFIKGRLKFGGIDTPAPFPSMLLTFKKAP